MIISGIRTTESFYNSINRVDSAEQTSEAMVPQAAPVSESNESKPSVAEIAYARRDQNQTSFEYAQKFDPSRNYTVEDHNARLENLDVESAISELQKDQMLQQYRFFVGDSASTGVASSEDAAANQAARPAENFIL